MTDVVTHHMANKQRSQENTHCRIDEVEPVHLSGIKTLSQQILNLLNQEFQHESRQSSEKADDQAQRNDKPSLAAIAANEQIADFLEYAYLLPAHVGGHSFHLNAVFASQSRQNLILG